MLTSTLFLLNLNAQHSTIDYNLNDYQLPDLKRHELEFNLDVSGYLDSRIQKQENDDPIESNRQSIYSGFSPYYSYYLNTKKFQLNHYISANLPNLQYYSSESNTSNYTTFNLNPSLDYSGEFREYLKSKFFLEQNVSLEIGTRNNRNFTEYLDDTIGVDHDLTEEVVTQNIDISLPVLVGWGRIERVEDARLAVYILDDLNKAGQLAHEVTKDDIEVLAREISKVRNERFFDSRLKKIWELKQIDSLLMVMGLIDTGNITYYTLLNDNWDYSNGPDRQSGFRISAGASPKFNRSNYELSEDYNYYSPDTSTSYQMQQKNRDIGGSLLFRINYEKPLNLYWQLSARNEFTASKSFSRDIENYNDNEDTLLSDVIGLNNRVYASIGYYPNSRTTMNLFVEETIQYWKTMPEEGENTKETQLISRFGINIDYYISPRIRLDLYSSLEHIVDKISFITDYSSNDFYYSFGVSLVYKLL